jgi:glucosamine-6-phosphate deaminase
MNVSEKILKYTPTNFDDTDDFLIKRLEKTSLKVFEIEADASKTVARYLADNIIQKQKVDKNIVLGLATGSSPIIVYRELVRMHREEGLTFKNVITFNLDEYYPMLSNQEESYYQFMYGNLFAHIDIPKENIHLFDGNLAKENILSYCKNYEKQIVDAGGIDIQILGIGRNGHIGFNEPGTPVNSSTRLVSLEATTRRDAAKDFADKLAVPTMALSMGLKPIMEAKEVILLAWGEKKAPIIRDVVEGPVTDTKPASFLQNHPNCVIITDYGASKSLTRFATPWLVGSCNWNTRLIRKAVLWLCNQVDKPILKLRKQDYIDQGLSELLLEKGTFSKINIDVFNDLQHTITGWPGGKPNVDDSTRPERANPYPKRVILFSPHPDDDVVSMGGTFSRLVQQNHEVHVAYQTAGNIAVSNDEALRYFDFLKDANKALSDHNFLLAENLLEVKAAIRRCEARASCRYIGLPDENIHFLNLPFYNTGIQKKLPTSQADIDIMIQMLRKVKPHQVYAAGDLSDPHGTHKVCFDLLVSALRVCKNDEWLKDCRIWLYKGAWQEWDIELVDMAVPLSPEEVDIKRFAIFKHQSQKDGAMYLGSDRREFWQRAEERNRHTAMLYNKVGMAEYEAIEAFVRYIPLNS